MEAKVFDIVVIGAGPGGYVAAIKAAKLGMKTAIIEKKNYGGTCLNIGCIPSKALLDSSKIYEQTKKKLSNHGISVEGVSFDPKVMIARKDKIVANLSKGVESLLKSNGVTVFNGTGSLISQHKVGVTSGEGEVDEIEAKNIILATGSKPKELPFLPYDNKDIISSDQALFLDEVPTSLVVVGAGAIGLEMASVWARLGSEVTVVEVMDSIVPGLDLEASKTLERALKKQKIKFSLGTKIESYEKTSEGVLLCGKNSKGKDVEFKGSKVLVATGRAPYYEGLGLEELGIEVDPAKKILKVHDNFQTSVPHIYAIGDIIHGPMLAHKAEEEGVVVAEIISGQKDVQELKYDQIPNVVYTSPEVASIGASQEELEKLDIGFKVGSFLFRANGRATCMEAIDGMVKILCAEDSGQCLGAHIVGPNASDMIHEIAILMKLKGKVAELGHAVHAHPTLSEAVKEAALDAMGQAIHVPPRKK